MEQDVTPDTMSNSKHDFFKEVLTFNVRIMFMHFHLVRILQVLGHYNNTNSNITIITNIDISIIIMSFLAWLRCLLCYTYEEFFFIFLFIDGEQQLVELVVTIIRGFTPHLHIPAPHAAKFGHQTTERSITCPLTVAQTNPTVACF